jgi:hypothetical protein
MRWLSRSLTFNRSSKDQDKFWMKFDSNETSWRLKFPRLDWRIWNSSGEQHQTLTRDHKKETTSLASDANTILKIILISSWQQDENATAFFLRANAVFTLSSRSSSCLEHPFSCRKWKGNGVSYETFLNTIMIWIQHRQLERAEPLLLHFQFYYLQ